MNLKRCLQGSGSFISTAGAEGASERLQQRLMLRRTFKDPTKTVSNKLTLRRILKSYSFFPETCWYSRIKSDNGSTLPSRSTEAVPLPTVPTVRGVFRTYASTPGLKPPNSVAKVFVFVVFFP